MQISVGARDAHGGGSVHLQRMSETQASAPRDAVSLSPQAALLEGTPGPQRQATSAIFGDANHGSWLLEGCSQDGTVVSFSFPSDGVAPYDVQSEHYGSARCWA
jgi:hypothetical protein